MFELKMNDNWRIHESLLSVEKDQWAYVHGLEDGWYSCSLPADVRMPLIENGVIRDPVLADYCRESEWIEKRAWWFERTFDGCSVDKNEDIIELILEGLDSKSDIFINGQYIGSHYSVHYPFVYDIKDKIKEGENVITVRVTSGLESVSDQDLSELNHAVCLETDNGGKYRGDARRAFVRRPQYTVGWDWGPKVITCGITGGARLEGHKKIALREVCLHTEEIGEQAKLKLMLNVENLGFISSRDGKYKVRISYEGDTVFEQIYEDRLFTSGYNYFEEEILIPHAKLWWPNGYGRQPLYEVQVEAVCEDAVEIYPAFRYGIRKLELNTDVLKGKDRKFQFVINGKPIYCKGGNWIPNDFIYARVNDEKYRVLTEEAAEANFNMLRIWGGGLYERDIFYDLCDEKGILIWHDFMFACSTYPDHHQWFREEMRREFDYQTKRLRSHSCLGLFCGTNEVHWLFNSTDNPKWGIEFTYEHQYGMYIANILSKEVIHANCPFIPYWNSSPYGGELPNDDTVGDIHHWQQAYMSKKMEERIEAKDYDKIKAKFVSEYGYVGPCCMETILEYMDGQPLDRTSEVWQMHNNVFEKDTVNTAIEKNYVDHADRLSLEDYITYAGMVHGMMYGYSLESMRFKEQCYGGLFWMYNDAWGEVGWTIIDYYLRRKIAYYGVKRALAHQKFTMRAEDGRVILQGANDTPKPLSVTAEFGYVSFDGTIRETRKIQLETEPGERSYLLREALPDRDYKKGTIMLYVLDENIDNIWLRLDDMRNLDFEKSQVICTEDRQEGNDRILTLHSESFAHGVHVKGNYRCSDNYFDLLPGETKTIIVRGAKETALQMASVR